MSGAPTGKNAAIDPDNPPLTGEQLARLRAVSAETLAIVRRGRPASAAPKAQVTLRIDQDTLAHFKAGGRGWQSRMNEALRKAAKLR